MAPTAATRARTNKPKPEPVQPETQMSTVKDEKSGKFLTVQQLKNKLRNEAEREVLDAHKGEVVQRTEAKYKQHGLEYVRRLSDEEKAAKQIEELYTQFPHLRPQLQQQQAQQEYASNPTAITEEAVQELADAEENGDYAAVMDAAEHLDQVHAEPGGPLEAFRAGTYEDQEGEDGILTSSGGPDGDQ